MRQRLVINQDGVRGVTRDFLRLGDYHRDCLTHEADLSVGQHRTRWIPGAVLARLAGQRIELAVDLCSRENRNDARNRLGSTHIDAAQPSVRVRTADELRVQHADWRQVTNVRASTRHQAGIFHPSYRGSNESSSRHWKLLTY